MKFLLKTVYNEAFVDLIQSLVDLRFTLILVRFGPRLVIFSALVWLYPYRPPQMRGSMILSAQAQRVCLLQNFILNVILIK